MTPRSNGVSSDFIRQAYAGRPEVLKQLAPGCGHSGGRPGGKYGVAAPERRTYAGRLYASRAEALRAADLDQLRIAGEVRWWIRQPLFDLGPISYRADFLVCGRDGSIWAEEVKGRITETFRIKERLWKVCGPMPLRILFRGRATMRSSRTSWTYREVWP